MKLYTTPGGQWAGTEKDWKAALKAEGIDAKTYDGRKTIEVPTSKAELMEFLTFYNVNVINPGAHPVVEATGGGASSPAPSPAVPDVEALRALHNPTACDPTAGDVVYLKSGSPALTVIELDYSEPGKPAVWVEGFRERLPLVTVTRDPRSALEASHEFNPDLAPPSPSATTMPDLDDLFEAAPLARQLHLASLACENARNNIR